MSTQESTPAASGPPARTLVEQYYTGRAAASGTTGDDPALPARLNGQQIDVLRAADPPISFRSRNVGSAAPVPQGLVIAMERCAPALQDAVQWLGQQAGLNPNRLAGRRPSDMAALARSIIWELMPDGQSTGQLSAITLRALARSEVPVQDLRAILPPHRWNDLLSENLRGRPRAAGRIVSALQDASREPWQVYLLTEAEYKRGSQLGHTACFTLVEVRPEAEDLVRISSVQLPSKAPESRGATGPSASRSPSMGEIRSAQFNGPMRRR